MALLRLGLPKKSYLVTKCRVHFLAISDDCRTIEFQPQLENRFLKNNMIRNMTVQRKSMCETQCFQEPNCVSYNYGPTNRDTPSCGLNSRTHLEASVDDFVVEDHYIHRSILVRSINSYYMIKFCNYIIYMYHFVPTLFHKEK